LEVHAVHLPLTQMRPLGEDPKGNGKGVPVCFALQSPLVEHAVHSPLRHVCPLAQSEPDWQVPHWPLTHPWPDSQFAAVLHAHDPEVQVPLVPHCESAVHAWQTLLTQAWLPVQSVLALHAFVHVPDPHAWPDAQSLFCVQEQKRVECVAVHLALGPHCESVEHAPQVPPEQISPAGHPALEVQPVIIVVQLPPGHDLQAWYAVQ
jgi:hypothetical protein